MIVLAARRVIVLVVVVVASLASVVRGTVSVPVGDDDGDEGVVREFDSVRSVNTTFARGRRYESALYLPPMPRIHAGSPTRLRHYSCAPPPAWTLDAVDVSGRGRALLVRRGVCSFEAKARAAAETNRLWRVKRGADAPPLVSYLIVYDNLPPSDSQPIRMVIGNTTGLEELKLLFVTREDGDELRSMVYDHWTSNRDNAVGGYSYNEGQFWDPNLGGLPAALTGNRLPVGVNDDFGTANTNNNHQDNNNNNNNNHGVYRDDGGRDGGVNGGGGPWGWLHQRSMPQAVQILRLILIASLILFPVLRCSWLWYSAGGRIRLSRHPVTNRPRIVVTPAHPRWLGRVLRDGEAHQTTDTVAEDVVVGLPTIVYGENDGGNNNNHNNTTNNNLNNHNNNDGNDDNDGECDNEKTVDVAVPLDCVCCSICLDDYSQGELLRVLPCGHTFHTECVMPWLTERQGCCPLCKTPVVNENNDDENDNENENRNEVDEETGGRRRRRRWFRRSGGARGRPSVAARATNDGDASPDQE